MIVMIGLELMATSGEAFQRWDLRALKTDVERIFGVEQSEALRLHLDSISTRRDYVFYHYYEAIDRIQKILDIGDDEISLFTRIVGSNLASQEYRKNQFEAGAHIVACLQSMHSTWDILAHAIYHAVGMNLDRQMLIRPNKICLAEVASKLSGITGMESTSSLLKEMSADPDFVYINAVVNQSKHRNVIAPTLNADMSGARNHQLMFAPFERDGKFFEARTVKELLEREQGRQMTIILKVGNDLNCWATSHSR